MNKRNKRSQARSGQHFLPTDHPFFRRSVSVESRFCASSGRPQGRQRSSNGPQCKWHRWPVRTQCLTNIPRKKKVRYTKTIQNTQNGSNPYPNQHVSTNLYNDYNAWPIYPRISPKFLPFFCHAPPDWHPPDLPARAVQGRRVSPADIGRFEAGWLVDEREAK